MATSTLLASGVLFTDRRIFYPKANEFAQLYASSTPFLSSLMARGYANDLDDPDFTLFEIEQGWREQYVDVNAGSPSAWSDPGAGVGTPGATVTVTIDSATGVTVDSSLLASQVEIFTSDFATYKGVAFVSAVASSTSITLKAFGNAESSTQAMVALADNDRIRIRSTSFGDPTTAPEASSEELVVVKGSTQLQRTTIEVGKTLARANLRGASDERARQRMLKTDEHKIKMSGAIFFSYRIGGLGGTAHGAGGGTDTGAIAHTSDAGSNTVRSTLGFFPALRRYGQDSDTDSKQNVFIRSYGTYEYDDFVDDSLKEFQYQRSSMKTRYCGPNALAFWSKVGADGLKTGGGRRVNVSLSDPSQTALGFNVSVIETPFGPSRMVLDEQLRLQPYNNSMITIDEALVELVRWEPDTYTTNIKRDNDPRVIKDQLTSFNGCRFNLMRAHSWYQFN